jgi:hypothetical protein
MTECEIVFVGKRRDGKSKHWCVSHKANATAKYGIKMEKCVAADDELITEHDTLLLNAADYEGGIAMWGAVPAVYDTTDLPIDRGIHVHARKIVGGKKHIDRTYRRVRLRPTQRFDLADDLIQIDETDAIYYMVSTVLDYEMRTVICTKCGFSHLDKDWFAVHYHQKHLCAGCGKQFKDVVSGIGNPLVLLKTVLGDVAQKRALINPEREIEITQSQYPLGIQIWGSNPAFIWTSGAIEEEGIHLHAYATNRLMPEIDDTFSRVVIDGVELDAVMVRTYMAQMSLPHIRDVVTSLICTSCREAHFDVGPMAFTPSVDRLCTYCGCTFQATGRKKKVISNPFHAARLKLGGSSNRPLQSPMLDLRPETI